ncbi:MAG TPA: pirin family protein [Sporosarcina psychrophila]|uniref:Pirin family protein n=1 Tax=Sporosarcina psychrophila TaxID=1476 RepID=A0A921FY39_SPOPS|nr:pirin family protein [Sporosarcina psychrophila]
MRYSCSNFITKQPPQTKDEILSYVWKDEMLHEDSTGQKVLISPEKHMMMGAGKSFFH